MTPALHIVASCADRKSHPAVVRLRDVRAETIAKRFLKWRRAIEQAPGARITAADLYQGGYWSVVRELPALARRMGWDPQLWVSSAGYGLVRGDARLVSYSATFVDGHEDSVGSMTEDVRDAASSWWTCATSANHGLGCSLETLARSAPNSTVLVIASPAYVAAMASDLVAARANLDRETSLFIVSSKIPSHADQLQSAWVPSSARLQHAVGGGLVSLHARVARYLLERISPRDFAKENVTLMANKLDEVERPTKRATGAAMSDEEVLAFIRARLSTDSKLSHTRLLRELRDSGQACEQGRFRRLFIQVKS